MGPAMTRETGFLKLLANGRKTCFAPIVAGGTLGVTHLCQGQYGAAILSVSTGAAMTLILLAAIAVGTLLIRRVSRSNWVEKGRKR